ncbi:MAG: ATP-binding cassette domain-containing protein [Candidatus Bipolaricaulota bacterium]|nr:ATP-binding cassette domain-containing protein [Candidatus Bipolaricaulota bacterium]
MSALVQVSELRFVTPAGKAILEDVTLKVDRDEFVCLVGPPSSGKTLILKLLYHEVPPQRGQILVDDRNVTRLHASKLPAFRRRLGIVPQELTLPQRTVLDALLFKLRSLGLESDESHSRAEEILDIIRLPLDMRVTELEPAQQKLCALALAAVHNPVLLLIDEPFDGLEYQEAERVLEGIRAVHERKHIAILATTRQRPWALRSGARVIYLWKGRTYAEAPSELYAPVPERAP